MAPNIPTYTYKTFSMDEKFVHDWLVEFNTSPKFIARHHPDAAKRLLDMFGIKSAMDVLIFLNSPEGKIVQSELNKAIDALIAQQEISRFMILKMLAQHRALIAYILGLMHDKAEAKHHLQSIIEEEQQYRKLHKASSAQKNESDIYKTLATILTTYQESQSSLENELEDKIQESHILERDWLIYEGLCHFISHESAFFTTLLHDIYRLEMNELRMNEKHQTIQKLYEIELIKLHQLCQMSPLDDAQLIACLQQIEGYQLQLTALNDLTFARMSLRPEEKLVLKNGKYYLLTAGMELENLSLEQQDAAHQAFLKLTPKLELKQQLLEKSRASDELFLAEQRKNLLDRSNLLQQQLNQLSTQYVFIIESIEDTQHGLNQIRTQQTDQSQQNTTPALALKPTPQRVQESLNAAPRPTPKPIPATPMLSSCNECIAKIELYQRNALSSPIAIQGMNRNQAMQFKQLELSMNQQMRPGVPVPPSLQQALARYPNAALVYQQTLQLTPVEPQPTAPRPSPFKNYPGY